MVQLLEVPEARLSENIRGKRAMNLDFARRLHERLGVPAEVVLRLRDVAWQRRSGNRGQESRPGAKAKPAPSF
jgi:plasmid maintenance system antidote protein VapI